MTTTFETANVGDKVWSTTRGWGEIIEINYSSEYPLYVKYDSVGYGMFTFGGHSLKTYALQSLFWDEVVIEAPVKPMPVLQVDAKVLVWGCSCESKVKRHFSHFENGALRAFDRGYTSWTGGHTTAWPNWELAE
jgi:hypothetical protein